MSLDQFRAIIQQDVADRGLASVPNENLFTACASDFANACRSIAETTSPRIGIVTGFAIPATDPVIGETDGPLGALFMARAFTELGFVAVLISDRYTLPALRLGVERLNLHVELLDSPSTCDIQALTHLISIERVGPTFDGRCRTMRGRDVTELNGTIHELFESFPGVTLGIGDGGNEIGMGRIPPSIIAANIPLGERIACRIATDFLIVAGVSNWGGYALATGVASLLSKRLPVDMFDLGHERGLLQAMVEADLLVDGVTGERTVTVDALAFDTYADVLRSLARLSLEEVS